MSNPQVAQGGKPLQFLDSVPSISHTVGGDIDKHTASKSVTTPYASSNTGGVGSVSHPTTSTTIAAQPNMNAGSSGMTFEKLAPKDIGTISKVPGTDYKP